MFVGVDFSREVLAGVLVVWPRTRREFQCTRRTWCSFAQGFGPVRVERYRDKMGATRLTGPRGLNRVASAIWAAVVALGCCRLTQISFSKQQSV